MINSKIDVSLLITFHNEGILAYSTLNSIERCRKFAEAKGITTEYILVLDKCSEETKNIVLSHPAISNNLTVVEVDHGDLGASRNSGVVCATGDTLAILDGDDYFSENWIERAFDCIKAYGDKVIIHPEMVINFGAHAAYCWQLDQAERHFEKDGLLVNNYWTSWTFAKRNVYLEHPYSETRPLASGFGYEDWHWNCEMIAAGFEHRLAMGTIGFYRRKKISLVLATAASGAIIPPSQLFSRVLSNQELA